jgi:hypothetical protein
MDKALAAGAGSGTGDAATAEAVMLTCTACGCSCCCAFCCASASALSLAMRAKGPSLCSTSGLATARPLPRGCVVATGTGMAVSRCWPRALGARQLRASGWEQRAAAAGAIGRPAGSVDYDRTMASYAAARAAGLLAWRGSGSVHWSRAVGASAGAAARAVRRERCRCCICGLRGERATRFCTPRCACPALPALGRQPRQSRAAPAPARSNFPRPRRRPASRDPTAGPKRVMEEHMELDERAAGPGCTPAEADDQVVPDAPAAAEALGEEELRFVQRADEAAAEADGEQRDSYIVAAE